MSRDRKHYLRNVITAPALVLVLMMPTSTIQARLGSDLDNPGIFPPDSSVYGHSYGEWAVRWWQWALSIPEAENPVLDTTGQFCDVGQSGPVWFLGGTFGNSLERTCTIPADKVIFMPVHQWIFGSGVFDCEPTNPGVRCDVPTLQASAAAATTSAEVVEAWIDGVPVNNIRDYRGISPGPFGIRLPKGAVFGLPKGVYYPQVADGYWLLLEPLPAGGHTIQVHVVNSAYGIDYTVTYHLTVGP